MTAEQIEQWRARRAEAKRIQDPAARQAALELVEDMKDDLQLDCQRKLADRVKELVASDLEHKEDLACLKSDVTEIKKTLEDHTPVVQSVRNAQIKAQGGWMLLKVIGILTTAFGSGAIGWVLSGASRVAAGMQ